MNDIRHEFSDPDAGFRKYAAGSNRADGVIVTFFVFSLRSSRSALGRFHVTYSSSLERAARQLHVFACGGGPRSQTDKSPTAFTISISCAAALSSSAPVAVAVVAVVVPAAAALRP